MTVDEVNAAILLVDNAYADLIAGRRQTKLVIGTGGSRREYGFQEITAELLASERKRLLDELNALQETLPTFRSSSRMQFKWGKF